MSTKFEIQEKRLEIFKRDQWRCCWCHESILKPGKQPQLAHVIPKKKYYIQMLGEDVINHPLNLRTACSLYCNSRFDINGKTELIAELVEKINKDIEK